jgi:hypothetical protein
MTLTEFLLARIAEDEAAARAAMTVHQRRIKHLGDGKWGAEYYEPLPADEVRRDVVCSIPEGPSSPSSSWSDKPGTAHFERFNPARVLAACAAYRSIVELHWPDHECTAPGDGYAGVFAGDPALGLTPCPTLRTLASIWADAPDYREEWA